MAVAKGAIYECSTASGDFPPLVVVLMDGKVIGCHLSCRYKREKQSWRR